MPNILAASLRAPRFRYSAVSSVINNDSMLKILLMHVAKDLEIRLISKTFMKAFDESCSEQLLSLDSRIKYLIQDEDGKVMISPIGTFLPKSVPLLKLYNSYLSHVYPLHRESFDDKFSVLQVPENTTADILIKLGKERNIIALRSFAEMLRTVLKLDYTRFPFDINPPKRLYRIYRLLMAAFSEQTFIDEIANSIKFPVKTFIFCASYGMLDITYGAEILSRFSINSEPQLIFNAIGSNIPDILRAILNNSQNDLSILKALRSEEFRTPMHKAAIKGNVEINNLLLERGFPANVEGDRGLRPIHLAASCGNYDIVEKLFEFDKDVTSSPLNTLNESAPIVVAARKGHTDIVGFFLAQATVDMTKNRETSRRLVEIALRNKNAELGRLLIYSGKVRLTPYEIRLLRLLK